MVRLQRFEVTKEAERLRKEGEMAAKEATFTAIDLKDERLRNDVDEAAAERSSNPFFMTTTKER